ncbi:MAG: hypothetical protein CSA66_03115 [Proteobacteria bacterium]|nr:MAG: hypothetical protein CSA66_03115 [Pseudomonadota bacterium]
MILRTLSTLSLAALLAGGLAACDSSSGGGGAAPPQDTNTASASVQTEGGGTTTIAGTDAAGSAGVFGADIAGEVLTIWITGDGSLLTGVVDTSVYSLPGAATMAQPPDAAGFLTVVDALAGTSLSSTGGTVTFNQCPKTVGQAFTGTFDNVALRDEVSGATSTLTGTFNLKVLTKAGDLVCTAPTTPGGGTSGTGGTDTTGGADDGYPGANSATCSNPTCDGPCCPFIPCLSTCTLDCEASACQGMDFTACVTCLAGCPETCEVSQACMDAGEALAACESQAGCDAIEDDDAHDACLTEQCCTQLRAAY